MSSDLLEPWVKPCGFLAREQPDLAVLDVNLHGHPVVAVAKRLRSLQIPLILALAYERFDFDDSEVLATAENVGKSFTPPQVLAASGRLDASGEWRLHNVLYRICACMYCKATDQDASRLFQIAV